MSITIGQRLKKAREDRYLTLEKAAEETRIRTVFLQALEADDYSVMPSAAQGRGFLRNYSEYLNINIDEVIAEMQRNAPPPEEVSGPLPQVNLIETDLPSLTDSTADKKPLPFWTVWLARLRKPVSTPELETSILPTEEPTPVIEEKIEETVTAIEEAPIEIEKPKTRGRKKKIIEEEILPVTPVELNNEPQTPQPEVTEAKAADENLPVEVEQVEVKNEAQQNLRERLTAFIQKIFKRPTSASTLEYVQEAKTVQVPPLLPADAILAEIGQQLRERRELISLTYDEVERHTRLRAVFIKALEEGQFEKLPSPVQMRGMLANYATFLDLDVDAVMLRFADALQARRFEKYSETPREQIQTEVVTSMPILRSFIAGDLIFGIMMIAILLALAVWGFGRVISTREEQNAQATAPSIVDVLASGPLPTPSPNATFIPVNETLVSTAPAAEGIPTLSNDANISISVFAVERTFIRVSVDGEVVFEGRISPRETQYYEAFDQIEILTGNAAALRISYNGRDLGLMGGIGEVASRVYTVDGVVTPTATVPPTATNTPLVTSTPTFTITPTATAVAEEVQ